MNRSRQTRVPAVVRHAARTFRSLTGVDAVWLAIREPRSRAAVIRWAEGTRCGGGLGQRIEERSGVGGSILGGESTWIGRVGLDVNRRLATEERALLLQEGLAAVMVVPLRSASLGGGSPRVEGLVYLGRRENPDFGEHLPAEALRLGDRLARPVRDAQRLSEAAQQWQRAWADAVSANVDAEHRLDAVASRIAADARTILRSGIGIVYRLDRASGALHSVAVAGEVVPGQIIPCVQRGQVLPPGCGSAGQAVATRAVFVAHDYVFGNEVVVPPIMSEAVPALPRFTTLSPPLIVDGEVVGAITVGRYLSLGTYERDEIRTAARLARFAAPVLARAQQAVEMARRQLGASELSRLAGSLTQSLNAEAVCRQLVRSVLCLAHGVSAVVWDADGRAPVHHDGATGILGVPQDPVVARVLDHVIGTRADFWTPDLYNDPRLAAPGMSMPPAGIEDRSLLAVPLRVRETFVAMVTVSDKAGRAFTPADVELVHTLADQAALGLASARAYHDLEVSRAELLRHEKLVAVGRLTAGLAHELRNPLQNVVAFTAELRDRVTEELRRHPDFEEYPEYLRRALGEAQRASGIVDRLLEYVREKKPTLESVDVRQVIAEAVALASAGGQTRGQEIQVTAADTPLLVQADPVMLCQVILNIVANALDALEGPGCIDVEARREDDSLPRGRVVVRVRDTGRGIPPEHLPQVFDPFFTTKEVGKGVGLGLGVCQSLIEQHEGRIEVSSPGSGQGTTVTFWLPAES